MNSKNGDRNRRSTNSGTTVEEGEAAGDVIWGSSSGAGTSTSGVCGRVPLRIRAQIKFVQLMCSNKRILRRVLRNLGGQDGEMLYDAACVFSAAVLGNEAKGKKLVRALICVFGEVFALVTNRIVSVTLVQRWGAQVQAAMEELCTFIDRNHQVLGIQLNDWAPRNCLPAVADNELMPRYTYLEQPSSEALAQLNQHFAHTIRRIRAVTLSTIGQNLSPASTRKLQKVVDKLTADRPLEEMCAFNSEATLQAKSLFAALSRMNERSSPP